MEKIYETIIIGSGPAGLTAAIYTARAKIRTLVITGIQVGGQLMLTTEVEDFPGFPEPIQGPQLMMRMKQQAERFGAEFIQDDVTKVETSTRPFKVYVGERFFQSKTIIVATGSSAKWLGLPSEKRLIGKGVSSCAVCDGPFFRDKEVIVVGGGDTAIREALFLAKFARQVYVVHRRDVLKAFTILQERAFATKNIKFIFSHVVEEILGKEKVEAAVLKDVKTGKTKKLDIDAVFVAIGHTPNTSFLSGQIDLDEKGYIKLYGNSKTSVDGIFAAGDVHDWRYQQAVTAAGAGCMAALESEQYLAEQNFLESHGNEK